MKSSTELIGFYSNGVTPQGTNRLPNLITGKWYHIALTCDLNQNLSIYLNGILNNVVETSGSQPSSSGLGIRLMRSSSDDYWSGDIGKIEIYNRILPEIQISDLYNKDKYRFINP
jgi:hypothetical protein